MLAATLTLSFAVAQPQPATSDSAAVDPVHVREVLTAKCGQCHGPQVPHPKGKFGFVTNLKRLAADSDYVVPGKPEDSYLWNQIDDGEMPPSKAKAGPLTDSEKHDIQEWITVGAPAPAGDDADEAQSRAPSPEPERAKPRSTFNRLAELIGKFHILTIHFPIALLAAAALAELWAAARRVSKPLPAVRFCLWLGAAAAVGSAALGWVHAYYMSDEPEQLLMWHRWLGTGAGVLAPLIAWLSERDTRTGTRRTIVRWAIVGLAVLAGVAGHFGGMLVYGKNFLSF
jgi:hypothetical protein